MVEQSPIHFEPDNRGLIIPLKEEDFAKFIGGLLGKPQTIINRKNIVFQIGYQDIQDCYQLVHQRVVQQNSANLIQFLVTIEYDDGSSVTLNSVEDFVSYREIRDLISVGVTLSWTYLIKFHGSSVPEKQIIELSLSTDKGRVDRFRSYPLNPITTPILAAIRLSGSNVFLRIGHTARTWGADIENLLSHQIERWDKKEPKVQKIVREHAVSISFVVSAIFFVFVAFWLYRSTLPIEAQFRAAAEAVSRESTDKKLDFLIANAADDPVGHSVSKALMIGSGTLIFSLFLWGFLTDLGDIPARSHLLLSEKAQKILVKDEKNSRWTLRYFAGTAIASTISGVLSRYLIHFIQ